MFKQSLGRLLAVAVMFILSFYFAGINSLSADTRLSTDLSSAGTIIGQEEEEGEEEEGEEEEGGAAYKEDINKDGNVNIFDLLAMLKLIQNDPENPITDFNDDGKGNIFDLLALLRNLGRNILTPLGSYSISGRVVEGEQGLAGIVMVCDGEGEEWVQASTDKDGYYRFDGLYDNTYSVKPIIRNFYYTFEPEEIEVDINGDSVVLADIEATYAAFSLSGRVVEDSIGLAGVSISVRGEGVDTTVLSDSLGMFRVDSLLNAPYVIVPTLENYTFTPFSQAVWLAGDSLIQDIQAAAVGETPVVLHTVAGKVYCTVSPLSDVTVQLTGDMEAATISDGNGNYSFLVPDGNYLVIGMPIPQFQIFNPGSHSVTVDGEDVLNLDFFGYGAGL